jgi:hypothetical protein
MAIVYWRMLFLKKDLVFSIHALLWVLLAADVVVN